MFLLCIVNSYMLICQSKIDDQAVIVYEIVPVSMYIHAIKAKAHGRKTS